MKKKDLVIFRKQSEKNLKGPKSVRKPNNSDLKSFLRPIKLLNIITQEMEP